MKELTYLGKPVRLVILATQKSMRLKTNQIFQVNEIEFEELKKYKDFDRLFKTNDPLLKGKECAENGF